MLTKCQQQRILSVRVGVSMSVDFEAVGDENIENAVSVAAAAVARVLACDISTFATRVA